MLDGFVAAFTGPLEFGPHGDHGLVTIKSGQREISGSMSRCDLIKTMRNLRRFIRAWNDVDAEVVSFPQRQH